jgi:putative glutamine transport system permease protein
VLYSFIALVYFGINFSLSCLVRYLTRTNQGLTLNKAE